MHSPTMDGAVAGSQWGALLATLSAAVVFMPIRKYNIFVSLSIAGRAWIVTAMGLAGFFVASEKAVVKGVGTDLVAKFHSEPRGGAPRYEDVGQQ